MAQHQRTTSGYSGGPNQGVPERRTNGERRQAPDPVIEERRDETRRSADRKRHLLARAGLAIDYLFFLLYALLALRIVLALVGANEQAGFVQLIHGATDPFYAPFRDIVSSPSVNGGELDLAAAIALFAYALVHAATRKLLRVIAGPAQRAAP